MAKKSLIAIQELLTANPSKYSNNDWVNTEPPEWLTTIQFNPPPSCRGKLCYLRLVNAAIYPQQLNMPSHYNEMPFTLSINFNQIDSFQSINNASGNNGPNTSKIVGLFCSRWTPGTEFPMITFQCPQGPQPLDIMLQANTPEIGVSGASANVISSLYFYGTTSTGAGQNTLRMKAVDMKFDNMGFTPAPGDTITISSVTGKYTGNVDFPGSLPSNSLITSVSILSNDIYITYKSTSDYADWTNNITAGSVAYSFTTNIISPDTQVQLTMLANLEPIE